MAQSISQDPSSYRDPSGFIFKHSGVLYRHVRKSYEKQFKHFLSSGLYQSLLDKKVLIPHKIVDKNFSNDKDWYTTLQPDFISFISYPYEWCFDQLKDAALLTLDIALESVGHGMVLKDATPYNIQLSGGRCIFIDSLSFDIYDETKPWVAYRQFCENFLAPLAIGHYLHIPMQKLLVTYINGLPIELTKKMLPLRSKLNLHHYLHLHLQARYAIESYPFKPKKVNFSKPKFLNLLKSLRAGVEALKFDNRRTTWSTYYSEAERRENYLSEKKEIVFKWVNRLNVKSIADLGSNEGEFSVPLSKRNNTIISADSDYASINALYNKIKKDQISNIFPVVVDLSNPSPSIGFNNLERSSFFHRSKSDIVLALAIVHHLTITHNIQFDQLAEMFSIVAKHLIIEFVPREDEKVQLMLQQKEDIYAWHCEENFLQSFSKYFRCVERLPVGMSGRTLFLMRIHDELSNS